MPKDPPNRLPLWVPKGYFELRKGGLKGAAAALRVGVSTSAGSVWFIKAGRMLLPDESIDDRYLAQDDRIVIAEGLLIGRTAAQIAEAIGKHRSTVYREISRGRGPDGRYNPWWSHNQAILRRARPKEEKLRASPALRNIVNDKLKQRWSPQQITRHLARARPGRPDLNACPETIYRALYTIPSGGGSGVGAKDARPVRQVAELAGVVEVAGVPEGSLEAREIVLGPGGGVGQSKPVGAGGLQSDDAVIRQSAVSQQGML